MKKSTQRKNPRPEFRADPNKILAPNVLRTNLLLSSLYLTAFEILKMAIVEGVKDFFILNTEITDDIEKDLLKSLQKEMVERFKESYQSEVDKYEKEVGIGLNDRDKLGLIPSCEWLQKQAALSESEVDEIRAIRDHRNEIAHELPRILISKGFDIKLEHFQRMRALIHKIDVFWLRNDLLVNDALNEVDIQDVADDEIISGRDSILALITSTVVEYLQELVQDKPVSP